MITTFYPPYNFGGDGIFVRNLAGELAARGHEVHVIHCRDSYRALAGGDPAGRYDDPPGVSVHGLESGVGPLSPFATQQTGRPLFKLRQIQAVLERGFDVIHYHNISLVGGPAVLALGRGIKLYTFHEYWLVCPTHLLFRFGRAPCEAPLCTLCSLSYGRPPQWWRATGALAAAVRHVDAFLSPSRFGIATHRRLGLDAPMIHLPSFVTAENRRTDPDGVSADVSARDAPYFLYVGRLEHVKGVQTLVEHFKRHGRARLLIAGEGSDEARLRRLIDDDGRIELLGFVDQTALPALYRDAVAVIVPSLAFEMLPLVILEAFREGTPVLVRNRGALPEIVADSGGGLVYDDDAQLDEALCMLLGDAPRRDELGRRARQASQTLWSPETHLRRYFAIIDDLGSKRVPKGLAS